MRCSRCGSELPAGATVCPRYGTSLATTFGPAPRSSNGIWVLLGCAGCGLLAIPILAAILFPFLAMGRARAQESQCLRNLAQIGVAMRAYSEQNDDRLPPAANWQAAITPYLSGGNFVFHCPSDKNGGESYGFNPDLDAIRLGDIGPDRAATPMVYDAEPTVVGATGAIEMKPVARHIRRIDCLFADGHVAWLRSLPFGRVMRRHGTPAAGG